MDLRWILLLALFAIGVVDSFCETFASVPPNTVVPSEVDCQPYVEKAIKELSTPESTGSTGHDDSGNHEITTDGSPPDDDVESPSPQDGNIADDSPANTPPESEESKEKEEVTGNEISSEKDEINIKIEENDTKSSIKADSQEEENTENRSQDNPKEENDVEISTEDENEDNNVVIEEINVDDKENNEEKNIDEPEDENETIAIIIDKELVKDNADILIDVGHLKKSNADEDESKSSNVVDGKKSEIIEKATSKKITTQSQTFMGTKKRNPKYWNFDPDEFPIEEDVKEKKIEKKRKRNPKYWHFDPDEDDTNTEENEVETTKPDSTQKLISKPSVSTFKGTKKRNPKYWYFDPDELPVEEAAAEKKIEKKRKRNPKYWYFDPDEDDTKTKVNEGETTKPDDTQKSTSKPTKSTFKGTKKRNPKYWNFDPDDYPIEEESKEQPAVKGKRNPKYWLFDPDEYPEGTEPDIPKKGKLDSKKDSAAEDRRVENVQKEQYILKETTQKTKKSEEKPKQKEIKKEMLKEDESIRAKVKETQQHVPLKTEENEKALKREPREAVKPSIKVEKTTKIKVEVQVEDSLPEEDLTMDEVLPKNLRNKAHIKQTLQVGENAAQHDSFLSKVVDATLKELKKVYDIAIKPLETTFKYKDLSNRHFGEPEIFSKPLVLFMGPWSGGKSSIINYLLDIEFSQFSLRTGAEPSPAYFNILLYNNREAILDGTQLAADWTFSGLQKFGQGLLDRLRGLKLPHPLLEKVNIVEIPGIMEMRKHVDRVFPFNDVCQWFIDRADVIFLVYDPAKLDVGPETEAILDQLKGREYQTRIILNKADKIRAEELMRIQGTLIWNISPLMSSAEPPIIYPVSLWSNPYEAGSPARLLHSQELSFLKDIRTAIDKRVENKIASARRFAVRVRNHAKMVDCYLTTYYNHKTFFGNKKKISDDIIEHPQNYHIYEGLSTLKNISRYDLPDPDVYRDFFRLNPIYEFKRLSETCTYFRGCPINKLDMAIAYDLPDLIGQYKRQEEELVTVVEDEP